MASSAESLRKVPLFALLDEEEIAVLAGQVETKNFAKRQRIYKIGDPAGQAYIVLSGTVEVSTVDEDHQEVVVDEPGAGEFFGFASMMDEKPHHTAAVAIEETTCLAIDRHDIAVLLQRKPMAGMDLLTTLGRQFHAAERLVQTRATRNPNDVIAESETLGERVADSVARFGGSWAFITSFCVFMLVYILLNVTLGRSAWDRYPFILLNLFLSMLAAIQAPIIMMSQNRQDKKDRVRSELDFEVNRKAESEIQGVARRLNALNDKVGDLEDFLRCRPLAD